jgi:hypothetical protein
MLLCDLSDATLSRLIEFLQKEQVDAMKKCSQTTDGKESKKLQREITLYNNLTMNFMKLRELKKPT